MSSRYQLIAEGSAAGLLFLLAPVSGYFLGKWIGREFGLGFALAYAGAVVGLVAAFMNLMRLVSRASR